jgi:hypothetical protein
MMVVPVRVRAHPNKEIKENLAWCQSEDLWWRKHLERGEKAGRNGREQNCDCLYPESRGPPPKRLSRRPILYPGLQSIPARVLEGRFYGMSGAPDGVDGASGLPVIQIQPEVMGEGTGTRPGPLRPGRLSLPCRTGKGRAKKSRSRDTGCSSSAGSGRRKGVRTAAPGSR